MSQRSDQVAEELRKIISKILIEEVQDKRMGFLTITRIDLTEDLRFARVYYSVLGTEEERRIASEAIADHLPYIKRLVTERINMRYATELRFECDRSADHAARIDEIIKKIHHDEPGKGAA